MADELGTAVLRVTVDDSQARDALRLLRQDVARSSRAGGGSRSGGSQAAADRRAQADAARLQRQEEQRQRAAQQEAARQQREQQRQIDRAARQGGAREGTRSLEIAQEKRFRLARRIDLLEERGVDIARLRSRLGVLTEAQSRREFGTFRQRSLELARQVTLEERRLATQRRAERAQSREASRGASQGGATESVFALEKAQDRRFRISQRIERLENQGADVTRLRTRLGELTTAQANRQFGTFRQLGRELERQVKLSEARLQRENQIASAIARQARIGGARESIQGRRGLTGSPADIAFLARQGGPRSPIGGAVDLPGSPAFLAAQRRFTTQELSRAAAIGGPRSPIGGALNIAGSPAALRAEERLAAARAKAAAAADKASIAEGRRTGKLNASPLRGGAASPGSPAFLDAQFPAFPAEFFRKQKQDQVKQQRLLDQGIKRRNDILSNALIGGAFPALFGQGLGASLGGAAGGAAGGAIGGQFGFGLSLVGTALGAQVDVAIQKFRDLAKALDDPIKNFDLLVQNASLSSKQVEKYAQALIESGRNAEAAAFIQSDLIETFGSLQGAKEYNNAIDTLSRSWSKATTVLAGFVAGPLAALIRQIEQPTSGGAIGLSFEQLAGQLTPEQYRQVQSRREQATESSRLSRGGISAFLPPSNEDVNRGLQAGVQLAQELLGIEKQRADLAARIAYAQVLSQKALSTSYELITASAQGYQLQTLEKQKEVALNERNIKLLELTPEQREGPQGLKVQQDAARSIYEIDVKINDLRKDRIALATEEAAKYELAAQKVRQEIQAVQALAGLSQNAQRTAQFAVQQSTLGTIQGIEAAVADARRREQEIGAQIDAARIRGGDAGEQEAARLVGEQKIAANQTRLQLELGARALTEAGIKLREDVQTAFLNLQKLRTGSGGLNQFLNPQDRANQEQRTFEALLPSFRQAQEQFKRLRGVEAAPEFTGTTSGVNQSILQFIDAVRTEQQALDTSVDTQRALNDNTAALAQVTGELRTTIAELNTKNWTVQVNVAADGSSQAFGDVLAGAVSP